VGAVRVGERTAGVAWVHAVATRHGTRVGVLDSKRSATKFRVLVGIADRQPAVNQGEIAPAVGVTSQAISEYIRELVADGFVEKEARSRYRVTKDGVDWLFQQAADVRRFAEHVTGDVLGSMQGDAAVAAAPISEGVIDLDTGDVTVFQVPPVRTGLPGSSESLRADAAPPAARSGLRPDVGAGLAPLAGLLDRLVVRRGVGVDDEPREF
jgi:predicted transcriptional regulator